MIVIPPRAEEAAGHVADMYEEDLRVDGFVYSHTQAMAINPEAHRAFEDLITAIVPSIGLRTYELVTLAAARALGSPHCLLAHGRKTLLAEVMDEEQLERVARDYTDAGLDELDVAVMAYAEKVSTHPDRMTDADSRRLRELGLTDRQIVDVTLAAAARNYFSRALQALAVPVEDVPGLRPSLARVLVGPLEG